MGGDYLDIVAQPDGSLLIAVADVAGKGLASAIVSTSFRSAFRAMAASGPPLDELATRMNQHHWAEGEEPRRRYVTAIFLRLHPESGEIEVVNAGHNPGFLVSRVSKRASSMPRERLWAFAGDALLQRAMRVYTGVAAAFLHRRTDRSLQRG